jgi:hypothetical protein
MGSSLPFGHRQRYTVPRPVHVIETVGCSSPGGSFYRSRCRLLRHRSAHGVDQVEKALYIGLTWDDGGKKGGAAFQADKGPPLEFVGYVKKGLNRTETNLSRVPDASP